MLLMSIKDTYTTLLKEVHQLPDITSLTEEGEIEHNSWDKMFPNKGNARFGMVETSKKINAET